MTNYEHREYREDGTYWVSFRADDVTRTVKTFNEAGVETSSRPYTAEENAEADATALEMAGSANEANLITKATQALAINVSYLDKATTTTAQDKAQIKALTRQVNALIRLATKNLDSTEGS